MPPIHNVDDAVRAAELFLGRYYAFRRLRTVQKENSSWYLEFDVGVLMTETVKMTIEGATGAVTSYQVGAK